MPILYSIEMSVNKKGQDSSSSTQAVPRNENDGRIDVSFMENKLEAWGTFYPAAEGGSPISRDYVDAVIEEQRLFHGVQREAIDEAVRVCNEERRAVKDVLIARGDAPIREIAEYIRLNPALKPASAVEGGADFTEGSLFVVVKKNQVLARQEPHRPGKPGKNVRGESIPCSTARPIGVSAGENTQTEGRFIVAGIDGQLIQTGHVISIDPALRIKGSLGRKTGNIIFPGDVYIEGPVSDGFKLYSGGSISIKQSFDVSDAISKGNLTAAGGIIGRGEAQVKVGGSLKTKSIESCRIACRKTVTVSAEIINSNIFCLETVEIAKGRIFGGEIWAVNGVRAGALMKISGRCPRIHCGVDFSTEQEKEKQNNMLRILSAKLGKIRQLLGDTSLDNEKRTKLEELRSRLEADQKKTAAAISELMGSTVTNEAATVEVLGEIAIGTRIEICRTALSITEHLSGVRIRLNKKDGKLVPESL